MAKIYYAEVDDFLRKEDRLKILDKANNIYNVDWTEITPDKNNNWLNEGMQDDWENFIQLSSKDSKSGKSDFSVFKLYSLGISTNRDSWVYNSNKSVLSDNIKKTAEFYNNHVFKYSRLNTKQNTDDFVDNDETNISWSRDLKLKLKRGLFLDYSSEKIRISQYRPFFTQYLYFDKLILDITAQFNKIFPTLESEKENLVICGNGIASEKPFTPSISNRIVNLAFLGGGTGYQCFPFYTYNEDGTNRRENITDWSLNEFRNRYQGSDGNSQTPTPEPRPPISKWDIFYYIYGVLHKPEYRTKYAANLRRELPRIPYYDDFWKYSEAGKKLADLHVNYEEQEEYPLTKIEAPGKQLDLRVEKMKLSKDKQTIIYNDFLSLTGIPYEAYEYKLGNRSAIDWIIDQYQIKTDKRSGIVNDPNRPDEPDYIIKLIGKIVTVSVETVRIVKGM